MLETVLTQAAAFLPVLLFLAGLRLMDSYKLVRRDRIALAILAGAVAAAASYLINTAAFRWFPEQSGLYARFGAPVIEELAKGAYWMFLIATARVAFMVDAGICAFAVGAGFALVENVFYMQTLGSANVGVFLLRGFGTSTMHGGVAAIAAMISILLQERRDWRGLKQFGPALVIAMAIHSFFNQGLLSPVISTLVMLVSIPVLLAAVFLWSESALRSWLGDKLDKDIELINMIATGELHRTRSGAYLQSLQDTFPPAIRADMLCMLQLTTELSVRAKGDMLLREAGLDVPPDPEIDGQFQELAYLERSIGRTGMLAIAPLLSQSPRDLWEMRSLARGIGR
jgi:RsiW-degrading membrane proteinase PrsW (M82 family)